MRLLMLALDRPRLALALTVALAAPAATLLGVRVWRAVEREIERGAGMGGFR